MGATQSKVIVRMPSPGVVERRGFPWVPLLVLLLVGGLAGALFAWESAMAAAIYPGVRIAGVDVGGKTLAEARVQLAPLRRAALGRTLTVLAGDQRWSTTPDALGLRLNLDDRLRQAYTLGREPDALDRYSTQLDLVLHGRSLSLIGNYDSDALHAFVQRVAIAVYRPAQSAVVTLRDAHATLTTRASAGRKLDAPAATTLLAAALADPRQSTVVLPIRTVQAPVSEADGQQEVAALNGILTARLHLAAVGRHWLLGAGVIAPAISLTTVVAADGSASYQHSVDQGVLGSFVDGLAGQIDRPMQAADVVLHGSRIAVLPAQTGYHLDRYAARQVLTQAILQGGEQDITLPVAASSPTTPTDAAQRAARQAAELIRRPLAVTFGGHSWLLTPSQLGSALTFSPRRDPLIGPVLDLRVDPSRLSIALGPAAAVVATKPADARFVVQGDHVTLVPSISGRRIDYGAFARAIEERGPAMTVPIPTTLYDAALTTAKAQAMGITDLLIAHTTHFAGSSTNRLINIHAAVRHLDGQLIAPGEVFSFNHRIGDITPQGGYVQGINIVDNQDVPGIGGGVCQVAVTLFQSAVYAGMPILERIPHANIVPYYDPIGMDATVYVSPDGPDVKFQNNTGHWVLISFEEDLQHYRLTARFFGTDPHFRVVVRGPYTKQQSNGDVDAVFYRTVYDQTGKVLLNAHFNSHYVPVSSG
jgi:vancomycin resistance protein YoaR